MSSGDYALQTGDEGTSRPSQPATSEHNVSRNPAIVDADPELIAQRSHASQRLRDITSDFSSAAAKLGAGDLVKDEFFTLFEAVGALEIMDAKMDSGYLAPNETQEDDFDVLQPLDPAKLIGIMDAIMCVEAAWQKGHPLSQTVFTSLYIDKLLWPEPGTLGDASFGHGSPLSNSELLILEVLRSYCLALIKTCDRIHQAITSQTYYEEEDFVSNLYNRPLLARFPHSDVCELVTNAVKIVESRLEMREDLRSAITKRLNLRLTFLKASAIYPGDETDGEDAPWSKCLNYLEHLEKTHHLGVSVPESFSARVQRKLASTVPPRPIIQVGFDESITFFRHLFGNATEVYNVLDCPRTSNIITFLQVFLSRKPQPAVYVRSLLQALIFNRVKQGHVQQIRDFCFEDLSELVAPTHILLDPANADAEHPQNEGFQIVERMNRFAEQVCDPFLDVIRALCMNRARARRMLCNLLVEWDNIQLDLEELDHELQQYTHETPLWDESYELPLSSWAYYHKLQQMQWVVQLGFELNIYNTDEWPGLYRYLQELAEHRHRHIGRIFGFLDHRLAAAKSSERKKTEAIEHSMSLLAIAGEEVAATAALAESLACLYKALSLLGLLPSAPIRPYGANGLRRALRLRPFMPLCLPALDSPEAPFASIDALAKSLQLAPEHRDLPASQGTALALINHADQLGRQARKAWENVSKASAESSACIGCEEQWRQGIRGIIRSAVVAGITGAKVRKWVLDGARVDQLEIKIEDGVLDEETRAGLAAPWIVPEARAP